jgi:hypothetical protein
MTNLDLPYSNIVQYGYHFVQSAEMDGDQESSTEAEFLDEIQIKSSEFPSLLFTALP